MEHHLHSPLRVQIGLNHGSRFHLDSTGHAASCADAFTALLQGLSIPSESTIQEKIPSDKTASAIPGSMLKSKQGVKSAAPGVARPVSLDSLLQQSMATPIPEVACLPMKELSAQPECIYSSSVAHSADKPLLDQPNVYTPTSQVQTDALPNGAKSIDSSAGCGESDICARHSVSPASASKPVEATVKQPAAKTEEISTFGFSRMNCHASLMEDLNKVQGDRPKEMWPVEPDSSDCKQTPSGEIKAGMMPSAVNEALKKEGGANLYRDAGISKQGTRAESFARPSNMSRHVDSASTQETTQSVSDGRSRMHTWRFETERRGAVEALPNSESRVLPRHTRYDIDASGPERDLAQSQNGMSVTGIRSEIAKPVGSAEGQHDSDSPLVPGVAVVVAPTTTPTANAVLPQAWLKMSAAETAEIAHPGVIRAKVATQAQPAPSKSSKGSHVAKAAAPLKSRKDEPDTLRSKSRAPEETEARVNLSLNSLVTDEDDSSVPHQQNYSESILGAAQSAFQSSKAHTSNDDIRDSRALVESAQTDSSVLPTAQPLGSVQAARLMRSLSESQLRVGINAGKFGKVDIHTSIDQNHITAKIYVEHEELGRELAGSLPQLHEKLEVQHRLEAQIELYNTNSDQEDRQQNQQYKETHNRTVHCHENEPEAQEDPLHYAVGELNASGLDMHV